VTTADPAPPLRGGESARTPIAPASPLSRPDRVYRTLAWGAGAGTCTILVLIGIFLYIQARPALDVMGLWGFLSTTGFNTQGHHPEFGVAAALFGTVVIAIIALIVAIPVSLASALFISEYAPRTLLGLFPLKSFLTALVDLMAAVPSIIYGLWGFLVLQNRMGGVARWMSDHLSFIPIFRVHSAIYTSSAFIAGTLVGIMVMPIITSLSREVFSLAPVGEREGALALGASRATMIRRVVLPFGRGGFVGAVMLGLGRALGETVAVTFIISQVFSIQGNILQGGTNSIASLIALRFNSGGKLGLSALLAAGLVLFFLTLVVNLVASMVVDRARRARAA
jgi:phosphate transport system permease protein